MCYEYLSPKDVQEYFNQKYSNSTISELQHELEQAKLHELYYPSSVFFDEVEIEVLEEKIQEETQRRWNDVK